MGRRAKIKHTYRVSMEVNATVEKFILADSPESAVAVLKKKYVEGDAEDFFIDNVGVVLNSVKNFEVRD